MIQHVFDRSVDLFVPLSLNCEVVDIITGRVRRITEITKFSVRAVDPNNGDWILYPLSAYNRAFVVSKSEIAKLSK